jgi:hypothetical protein
VAAEPLEVEIEAAAWEARGGEWAWGVRVVMQGATVYDVYDQVGKTVCAGGLRRLALTAGMIPSCQDAEEQWMKLRAAYRACLGLPILVAGPGGGRVVAPTPGAYGFLPGWGPVVEVIEVKTT